MLLKVDTLHPLSAVLCNTNVVYFTGLGLGFLLGADYDRKKQKLQQELQLDYKRYVATV